MILPERTNITLESFDMANMGGDSLAFGYICIASIFLIILFEFGLFYKLCKCIKCSEGGGVPVHDEPTELN